jgi:hypothetical protein
MELIKLTVNGVLRNAIFSKDAFVTATPIVDREILYEMDEDNEEAFYATEHMHLVRSGKQISFKYIRDLTKEERERIKGWDIVSENA